MGERFAGVLHVAECQKDRADRVVGARIRDDHLVDRLGVIEQLVPDTDLVQHPPGSGGNGRGPFVLRQGIGRRCIHQHDMQVRRGRLQRNGSRQPDIATACNEAIHFGFRPDHLVISCSVYDTS